MKETVRAFLRQLGFEVFRARGGLFLCPTPQSSKFSGKYPLQGAKRLHLGCGSKHLEGYVNIDIVQTSATDLTANITQLDMFPSEAIEEIHMEAVYEHLYRFERKTALKEWFRLLCPGGKLTIDSIPDFDVFAENYLMRKLGIRGDLMTLDDVYLGTHGDPVQWNAPEQLHKDLFTKDQLRSELEAAGFEIESIENVCFEDEPVAVNINVVARRNN